MPERHDYRVWNPQLIGYAGYKNKDGSILGDKGNVEFTEVSYQLIVLNNQQVLIKR